MGARRGGGRPGSAARRGARRGWGGRATRTAATGRNRLASLADVPLGDRPEPAGRRGEVGDPPGVDLHETRRRGVDGRQVRAHDQDARGPRGAHDRAVPLHAGDPVDDRQVRGHGRVDVEDRLRDPLAMEDVLRPAVADAGHHAEEVLHRARDPGPVVRLELRQRDDQVGAPEGGGQAEPGQLREPQPVGDEIHVVVVQVDERDPVLGEHRPQARLLEHQVGVSAVPLALRDEHLARPPAAEDLGDRPDHGGVRVDVRGVAERLDQVRLEQHRLAPRPGPPQAQLGEPPADDPGQVVAIRRRPGDEDIGAAECLVVVQQEAEARPARDEGARRGQELPASETRDRGRRGFIPHDDAPRSGGRPRSPSERPPAASRRWADRGARSSRRRAREQASSNQPSAASGQHPQARSPSTPQQRDWLAGPRQGPEEVPDRPLDELRPAIHPGQGEQRKPGRRRLRPEVAFEEATIPVIPAPGRDRAVADQSQARADPRVIGLPVASQGQDGHGRRLQPGMGVGDPGPADEGRVVADDAPGGREVGDRNPPLAEQPPGRSRPRGRVAAEGPPEQDAVRRRPARGGQGRRDAERAILALRGREPGGRAADFLPGAPGPPITAGGQEPPGTPGRSARRKARSPADSPSPPHNRGGGARSLAPSRSRCPTSRLSVALVGPVDADGQAGDVPGDPGRGGPSTNGTPLLLARMTARGSSGTRWKTFTPRASSALATGTSFGCPWRLTTRRTRFLSMPSCSI